MSCGCYCCRKPRYKRLVDALYPEDPQDTTPVASNLDKLLYFASSSPEHLDRVGDYLALRLRRSLNRDRRGHVCVSLKIIEKLLSECDAQRLQLITDSYLKMLHSMLESSNTDFQIMATDSFVMFSEREEQATPYHRQYDFFIHRFATMALVRTKTSSPQSFQQTRKAGLRGLSGVIKKTEGDESLQLNIWEPDDLNKIIPPFLFNLQHNAAGSSGQREETEEGSLVHLAEEGLKALVASAGLAHIDAVFTPVLQHLDLNHIWTEKKGFAVEIFITIIKTMQKQYRYKAIQALVGHLDKKANESCSLKQGILDTLSQCVGVAADGSLGPSVLDVFRTLVRHLRISIESNSITSETSDNSAFQDSLTRTMGEFAGVLPDYHKPDIMTLITSYMGTVGVAGREVKVEMKRQLSKESGSQLLRASLVRCMRSIADTYHPEVLETTLPETLFTSLVQMLRVTQPDTQLDVCLLWHQLIDHHDNKQKIPLHTKWESLESCGLILGKVSQHFLNQTRSSLYSNLYYLALNLSHNPPTLLAFYHLLALLALEFAQLGVMDMIHFLSKVQDAAQDSNTQLSSVHRASLHAVIAGILYMLSKISPTPALNEHVEEMIGLRREVAPALLPDGVFSHGEGGRGRDTADSAGGITYPSKVGEELLFQLRERGLDRQSPEPAADTRRGFLLRESSTSSNDFLPHASLSLDYGVESPLSVEQINFDSFKQGAAFDESPSTEMRERLGSSLTYEQQVGISSRQGTGLGDIAHLVQSASPVIRPFEDPVDTKPIGTSAYDIELPVLNSGL